MSEYPWNLLAIEPTTDEMEVRRAYARRLRVVRPDDDPQQFAALVQARAIALQACAADSDDPEGGHPDLTPFIGDIFDLPSSGEGLDFERWLANSSPDFSSQEPGPHLPGQAVDDDDDSEDASGIANQRATFRAILDRLWLLPDLDTDPAAGPTKLWQIEPWSAALTGLEELSLFQRRILRNFVLAQAIPQLPPVPVGPARRRLSKDPGPCSVIALLESEFDIRENHASLAKLCGSQAMLRTLDWLALATSMRDVAERCARAYRDEAGIPLLPANDLALGVLPEKARAALERAQARGRWPLSFSLLGFLMPALALVFAGLRWWGLVVTAIEGAILAALWYFRVPLQAVAAITAVLLLTHLLVALAMTRLTAVAALWRVRDADRQLAVTRAERFLLLRPRDILPFLTGPIVIVALLLPILLAVAWKDATTRAQRSVAEWIALGQMELSSSHLLDAIDNFTAAIEKDGTSAPAYRGRGEACLQNGDPQRALADYDRAIALVSQQDNSEASRAFRGRGGVFSRLGDTSRAFADYDHAIALSSEEDKSEAALAFRDRGDAFNRLGDTSRALDDFNHAIALNPDDIHTHLRRVAVYFLLKRADLAVSDYEAVAEIDPLLGVFYSQRIWELGIAIHLKDKQAGLPHSNETIKVEASDPAPGWTLTDQAFADSLKPDRGSRVPQETVVLGYVDRNGRMSERLVAKESGDPEMERTALATLDRSDPLPVPPLFSGRAREKTHLLVRIRFRDLRSHQ